MKQAREACVHIVRANVQEAKASACVVYNVTNLAWHGIYCRHSKSIVFADLHVVDTPLELVKKYALCI